VLFPASGVAAQEPAGLIVGADEAMAVALRDNAELAALRQRFGIAAAEIVIARNLPVNPAWTGELRGVSAPRSSNLGSHVTTFHALLFTIQPPHARDQRVQAAQANLSRTESEIAFEETRIALQAYTAFYGVLYRKERLALYERLVHLTEETTRQYGKAAASAPSGTWCRPAPNSPPPSVILAWSVVRSPQSVVKQSPSLGFAFATDHGLRTLQRLTPHQDHD
jgi:hypothetical protein